MVKSCEKLCIRVEICGKNFFGGDRVEDDVVTVWLSLRLLEPIEVAEIDRKIGPKKCIYMYIYIGVYSVVACVEPTHDGVPNE